MKQTIIFIAIIALVAANSFLKKEETSKAMSLLNFFTGDFIDGSTYGASATAPSGTYAGTF
jgi:hypothetical protein